MASARVVGLRYVNDGQPGLRRIKAGANFRYEYASGKTVRDQRLLRRIRSLAIPPAWTDVWICRHENGHLQATGRDARGRKQHRYHPLWREVRDATKYDRMIEFGETLPRLRQRISRDLARPKLVQQKVLATVVRLMDVSFIRVGNDEYARQNGSYGLTTMKDQHAEVRGGRIQFSFRGKSGKHHSIEIEDRRLAGIVKHCQDIPGQELFQYLNEEGKRRDITSGDVNEYLREISGTDFTAKDFRTWAGTVLMAQALKTTHPFHTQAQAKKNVQQAVKVVAERLGNTPAVCRKCYVHPFVIEGYMDKRLRCAANVTGAIRNGVIKTARPAKTSLSPDEREVLKFLHCCRRAGRRRAKRITLRSAAIPQAWRPRVVRGMRVGHR
jgi:DNA topoisomerase I